MNITDTMEEIDITVVGGCVTDLISSAPRFPKPGETLIGHNFMKNFGGNGANQCIMAQRLGASTALVTKLGNDSFGYEYLQNLKDNQVKTDYISMTNECSSGTAMILVDDNNMSSIIYVPGSLMKLSIEDVRKAKQAIKNSKILLVTYEMPLDSLLEALKIAKDNGVLTVLNAAPPQPSEYENLFPLTDILCLNEEEAEAITGINIIHHGSACKALSALLLKINGMVILTLGENGVIYQKTDQENCIHIPATCVEVVDCLGAGDAFLGSLVYFLSKHKSLPFNVMVQRSCEIAAITVTKHGTQPSYPYAKDLPEYLLR